LAAPPWVHSPQAAPTARGERTRQRVVEAAEDLFRNANSYENIGVADIARASHTSVGTIYRYFCSKDDLLHLVLSNSFWRMYNASTGTWHKDDGAAANLERTTRAYLEAYWEERSFLRLALHLVATSDSVREMWLSMNKELRQRMQLRLEQDQAASELRSLDPTIMLQALLGMVNDYAASAFIDEKYGPASRDDIPRISEVLARIWYRALFGADEPAKPFKSSRSQQSRE
jgi:AcrR family transcriptional regulator